MIVRTMVKEDLNQLYAIYEKFYKHEFNFPDFTQFASALVVVENDQIITGGGLVAVPEAVILTDQNVQGMKKIKALLEILQQMSYNAKQLGAHQIHAFIQDSKWESHLRSMGFDQAKGTALVLNL